MSEPQRLPPGYYLDNFERVLDTVRERYGDLLLAEELRFVSRFQELSRDARRLWVRLASRRGPWFRPDRLRYPEIGQLDAALEVLARVALLDAEGPASSAEWLAYLRRDELHDLGRAQGLGLARAARRGELESALLAGGEAGLDRVREGYQLVRPLEAERVELFCLLFFGNRRQDLSTFVVADLGIVRFESYALGRDLRRFPDRGAVDDALELGRRRDALRLAREHGDQEEVARLAVVVAGRSWHPVLGEELERLLVQGGRALERLGRSEEALELFAEAQRPPARERRVRILARLGRIDEALDLCREMEASPRDETEVVFAPTFARRLGRPGRSRRSEGSSTAPFPIRHLELPIPGDEGLERAVLGRLAVDRVDGVYGENWLWQSLFGLAFWDVVFAPVPGAFEHPFQLGPRDLHGPAFRRHRAHLVEERLAALSAEERPVERLLALWDEKEGVANALVRWEPWAREGIARLAGRLRGSELAWICDRLARDPRRYRRGLPDLVLLPADRVGVELWEVKGPGDQLRPEQRRWLTYLSEGGFVAGILRVAWAP